MQDGAFERIHAFKMGKMDLRYQPHLKRCEMLYRVIEEHVDASIAISVPTDDLSEELDSFQFPSGNKKLYEMKNPYFWGFYGLISVFLKDPGAQYLKDTTDLFLDRQQEESRILQAWQKLKENETTLAKVRGLPFSTPTFRDDEECLPLQAADMFAFWCRKWESENRFMEGMEKLDFPWAISKKLPRFYCRLNAEVIRETLNGAFGT